MTIHELIEKSGQSRRTIYYYIQLGLLPSPKGKGRVFEYSTEHLERLKRIAELQAQRFSLKEIKHILDREAELDMDREGLVREVPLELGYERAEKRFAYDALPTRPVIPPGETWQRFSLADGIELLVRLPVQEQAIHRARAQLGPLLETLIKGGRR